MPCSGCQSRGRDEAPQGPSGESVPGVACRLRLPQSGAPALLIDDQRLISSEPSACRGAARRRRRRGRGPARRCRGIGPGRRCGSFSACCRAGAAAGARGGAARERGADARRASDPLQDRRSLRRVPPFIGINRRRPAGAGARVRARKRACTQARSGALVAWA